MFNLSADWKKLRIPHFSSRCWCRPAVVRIDDTTVSVHQDGGAEPPADVVHEAFQDVLRDVNILWREDAR